MDQYRVRHGGANLYVETHGPAAGPPVLLLHGGIGSADDWAAQVPALVEAGYRVVAMDCRARGRSTWGEAPLTFAGMTADALAVLDALGIAQADLIGWSDGAIIGLHLAINHRERLRKLVLYGGLARCDRSLRLVEGDAYAAGRAVAGPGDGGRPLNILRRIPLQRWISVRGDPIG